MPDKDHDWVPTDAEVAEALSCLGVGLEVSQAKELEGSFNRIIPYVDAAGEPRLLRMRPRWMTEKRISFEHAFARHLAQRGLPTVMPLAAVGADTWFKAGDILCEVYPFIEGRVGRPVRREARLAGALLGAFHRHGLEFDNTVYQPPDVQNQLEPCELEPRLMTLRESADGGHFGERRFGFDSCVCERMWARWNRIQAAYPADRSALPRVLRHGDFHIWNLLFSRRHPTRIVALLDLDMAAEGPRAYDISYAIYFLLAVTAWRESPAVETRSGRRWRTIVQEFSRGCVESGCGPMSAEEIAVVPLQLECIALHFMYWDIVRADSSSAASAAVSQYLALADWVERHDGELSAALGGGAATAGGPSTGSGQTGCAT